MNSLLRKKKPKHKKGNETKTYNFGDELSSFKTRFSGEDPILRVLNKRMSMMCLLKQLFALNNLNNV